MRKNQQLHLKVDFEGTRVLDAKRCIHDEGEFDDLVGGLKLKLFGGSRRGD